MNFLSSLSSAVINASTAALSGSGGIPGLAGYTIGEKVISYEGKSIWTLYEGIKKDDTTAVSIFNFDCSASPSSSTNTKPFLPLAKNALRKLRTMRHPNILKFIDGTETETSVWIITEAVRSLSVALEVEGLEEESKVYGLLHLATALSFLNKDGGSLHGNVRHGAIWIAQGGEWKLGGFEVCTRKDDDDGILWKHAGILPEARNYCSPEVRKIGWTALRDGDASALDSYQLHLLLYTLFNGPLPIAFSSYSEVPPALPNVKGSIPQPLFSVWRRLGNPNPRPRLKTDTFLELGMGSEASGGGWWPANRLVKLSTALEGFALASENERAGLIRTLKEVDGQRKTALPEEFLKYKVLPSLVRAFEFGGGGPTLLPLILSLAESLPEKEYTASIIQPLIRMFATPDRAMRMALLEGLDKFADKLSSKDVTEKIWPHLLTGFTDVVPVIREATVKSILTIAPKLNDRLLNNDLLRHLAKTQTDPEAGIRTNTCILLGRLSRHLQPVTNRKVLIPAFARALRDPFVHARIAGLMALMATADCYEKEDLAGRVIPAMAICLIDREKAVRDQGYKAMDMFVKKCESLTINMPEVVVLSENGAGPTANNQAAAAAGKPAPLAITAAGAGAALAGWAFASVSKSLSAADLESPIDRSSSAPPAINNTNGSSNRSSHSNESTVARSISLTPSLLETRRQSIQRRASAEIIRPASPASTVSIPGSFNGGMDEEESADWGGEDLMDVNDDDEDWNSFESGPSKPLVDPFAARLSISKPKLPTPIRKGPLKLGSTSKISALRTPVVIETTDDWGMDEPIRSPLGNVIKPKITSARPNPATRNSSSLTSNSIQKAIPSPSFSNIISPKINTPTPIPIERPIVARPVVVQRRPSIVKSPPPPPKIEVVDESWDKFDEEEEEVKPEPIVETLMAPKEEKAAKMAAAREERRQRMAKSKAKA